MSTLTKPWESTRLLDIVVDCPKRNDLLDWLFQQAKTRGRSCHMVTMNAEMAYAATQEPAFMQVLNQADLIIPDGIGVVWALKRQGIQIQRLPGVELVEAIFKAATAQNLKLAILGSSPDTLAAFTAKLDTATREQALVFCQDGYFKPEQEADLIERLQQAQPDILFVALGVPRQENWIASHRDSLRIPVLIGVGGSFDVLSGRLQRAPVWMQRMHLEWLYRLYQQPTRWRRMLALPQFVMKVLRT